MAWTSIKANSTQQPAGSGVPISFKETAENDQDKTFDMDVDAIGWARMDIIRFRVEYVAAAVAGSRLFEFQVTDSLTDPIWDMTPSASVVVTSGNTQHVQYDPDESAADLFTLGVVATLPDRHWLPRLTLHSGMSFRYRARAGNNAADDMTLHLEVVAYK